MGKNLVIIGADFSENGIKTAEKLVPSWTNSNAWVAETDVLPIGTLVSSITFKASDKIELPQGASTITYTRCIYTTSAGGESKFGLVFWDGSDNPISGDVIPMGSRGVTVEEIEIPNNAVYVSFTYFKETDTPFSAIVNL